MNNINIGAVALKVFDILILKFFTLPVIIYRNVLIQLSNTHAEDSEESNLSSDFPIFLWFANIWNALVILSYPLGIILSIKRASDSYYGGFKLFMAGLIITYFLPLLLGLIREAWFIVLKIILYLKIISKK